MPSGDRTKDLGKPALRAGLRPAETWEPSAGPIGAPFPGLRGPADDIDPYDDMVGWRHHTTGDFAMQSFAAGHFFLRERRWRS